MRRIALVAGSFASLVASQVLATTHTWNGGNAFGPTSMSNTFNWSGGVPVSGSSNLNLVFPASPSNNNPNQNIANPLSLQTMSVAGGYLFNGNGFRFDFLAGPPSLTLAAGSSVSFSNSLGFTYPTLVAMGDSSFTQVDQLNGGDVNFNGNGTTSQSSLVLQGSTSNTVVNAAFTGFQIVYVSKPANVAAFGGNVALQGTSPSNPMQFRLQSANQFAPGANFSIFSDAMAILYAQQTVNNLEVTGSGALVNNNGNTLTVQGSISSTGAGFASIQNGDIDLNGTFKTVNCSVASASLSVSCPISNGRILKTGPGTFGMFNSGNTFTGQNVVNGGVLVGNPDSLGTSVLNNAIVQLGSGSLTTSLISGPGLVRVGNINFFAPQSYTGGTDILGVAYGDASTLLGDFTSTSFGDMIFQQITNGTYSGNLSGNLKLTKQGGGILSLNGTNTQSNIVTLSDGGFNFLVNNPVGTGTLLLNGFGVTLQSTGSVSLPNNLQMSAAATFIGSGNLNFTDTTPKTVFSGITHNSTGTTTIAGKFTLASLASIVVNSGNLVLGDAAQVGGFSSTGSITLNGGTLTVNSFNFTTLSDVTLAGGTLNAPNGYAIPLGAALQGTGGVTGRVASANGSTIIATGNLVIGDGSHPAGVNLDGELYTNANTVTLQDANQSVLGSYTRVGTVANNGTLIAPKGLVINFGRNLAGRGQVISNNNLANAVIVNGDASGDSFTNYLDFTGYVKGVGTFNNVAFSGTFSPGLSPALLTVGSILLTPSNVLDIELGGLLRGSQYDAFDVNGTMVLDGQLKLTLINSFTPSLGNQFDIFNGNIVGTFTSYNFPTLSAGLFWDTSLLYSQGIVQVVNTPEPTSLAGLAISGSLLSRRRRGA